MKKYCSLLPLCLLAGLYSCGGDKPADVLTLDLAEAVRPCGDAVAVGRNFDVVSFNDVKAPSSIVLQDMGQSVFRIDGSHFGLVEHQLQGPTRIFRVDESDGRAELVIDCTGRGPGEYLSVSGIEYRGGKFTFADEMSGKFLTYDAEGNFVCEKSMERGKNICYIKDGNICVGNMYGSDTDLDIFAPDGMLLKSYKLSPDGVKSRMLGPQGVKNWNGAYIFQPALSDTLYRITVDAAVPYMVLQPGKYKMPESLCSTLDYAAMSKYIDNVDCRVYGDYAFCSFNHSEKLYRTVWSLKDASLLFSTAISGPDDVLGPQVEINGEQVCVWPDGGNGDDFYSVLLPPDAERLFPDRGSDAGPVVVHVKVK